MNPDLHASLEAPILHGTKAFIQEQRYRKRGFLEALKSTGKLDYKRYLGSPLRYAGGKSLAVGYVVEHLPDGLERLVSPFMGGGSVEVACAREIGMEVIGYDVFDILCNYWRAQLRNRHALYKRLKQFPPTRKTFRSCEESSYSALERRKPLALFGFGRALLFQLQYVIRPALPRLAIRYLPE